MKAGPVVAKHLLFGFGEDGEPRLERGAQEQVGDSSTAGTGRHHIRHRGAVQELGHRVQREISALSQTIRTRSTGSIYGYIGFVLGALFVALLLIGVIYR